MHLVSCRHIPAAIWKRITVPNLRGIVCGRRVSDGILHRPYFAVVCVVRARNRSALSRNRFSLHCLRCRDVPDRFGPQRVRGLRDVVPCRAVSKRQLWRLDAANLRCVRSRNVPAIAITGSFLPALYHAVRPAPAPQRHVHGDGISGVCMRRRVGRGVV